MWWNRPSVTDRLIEQHNTLVERLMADSEAKTAMLDRIIASKFDPPMRGDSAQPQPDSAVSDMIRAALSGEDDREFIERVEEGI